MNQVHTKNPIIVARYPVGSLQNVLAILLRVRMIVVFDEDRSIRDDCPCHGDKHVVQNVTGALGTPVINNSKFAMAILLV